MQTLSHGVQKPENGDTGGSFFPALALLCQLFNDHTHNGSDGELISVTGTRALKQLPTIVWTDTGDSTDTFETTVSLPGALTSGGHTFESLNIQVRSTAGGLLYLRVEKATDTSFKVYSNDNSLAFAVIYSA